MAVITGTLMDVGGGHLIGKHPELMFELNVSTTAKSNEIYATEPARATPDADGKWTANLAPTTLMTAKDAHYKVSIRWQDSSNNITRMDFPDLKLTVPPAGGSIGNLMGPITNPMIVYVSLTPPPQPFPFTLWLQQDPENPGATESTGNLYEWRNA